MGREYSLQFEYADPADVARVISQLPMASEPADRPGVFEFRSAESVGAMPHGEAHVDSEGMYYCDYGNRKMLKLVVEELERAFGPVAVEELE